MLQPDRFPVVSPFDVAPPFNLRHARVIRDKDSGYSYSPPGCMSTIEAIKLLRGVLEMDLKTAKDIIVANFPNTNDSTDCCGNPAWIDVRDVAYLIACITRANTYTPRLNYPEGTK